ncbi:MAG: F0F1 ATP synthase subunit B [Acidimicrobiales bacterium]|nr:F0F1 ATP synthase subunit B [Acidimicrobiales bacterium]
MNRTLKLLSAALIGGVALLFGTANPAGAVEETIGSCVRETFEEFEAETEGLDEGSDAYHDLESEYEEEYEDCLDAPNPLLPETNEIIWGSVGFVVVFLFLAKFGGPAIKKMMDERADKIQGDLDAAESAKAEAEEVKAEYASKLADAKSESARIIEEARQAADQLKSDQQARLNEELVSQREQAQADIDAAKSQAMAELRGEVSEIAVGAAERVVGANLDRAAQDRLIEDYINDVANPSGSNGNQG